jgi:type VI protein secretion system component VasF
MMTVAYVCEWMEHSVKGVASYFTVFFAIFIVVWLVRYIGWKIYISKIKEKITKQI